MSKKYTNDCTTMTVPCEFTGGTPRAYFVMIDGKEMCLARKYTKKLEDSVRIPRWFAKKVGLL